jgi:hypothetical protein
MGKLSKVNNGGRERKRGKTELPAFGEEEGAFIGPPTKYDCYSYLDRLKPDKNPD